MSIYVLFFGGYLASQADMNAWLDSAKGQRRDVDFDPIPWAKGVSSDGGIAVRAFTKAGKYAAVIAEIGSSGADQVYIVGHSSGCAIANAVDRGLDDHSNVVLVALDGYVPNGRQLARPSTQVWAAACGDAKSLHYDTLKDSAGSRFQVYPATDCTTKWALHFSLVNAAASDDIVKSISTGYAQCEANLVWLK